MTEKAAKKGKLFVISGPSGAGKSTLADMLFKEIPGLRNSISATTRKPREGEVNGREYFFLTEEEFRREVENGRFAEWCIVYGNYYGTPLKFVDENLKAGKDVVLEIDVQGAQKIKKSYPGAVLVFVKAPSLEVYRERLEKRNKDSKEVIEKRISIARKGIEMMKNYKHEVINDGLKEAYEELKKIIMHEVHERNAKGTKSHGKEG